MVVLKYAAGRILVLIHLIQAKVKNTLADLYKHLSVLGGFKV